jgi:hypothetical protein
MWEKKAQKQGTAALTCPRDFAYYQVGAPVTSLLLIVAGQLSQRAKEMPG